MPLSKRVRKLFSKRTVVNLTALLALLMPSAQTKDFNFSLISPSGYHVTLSYRSSKS
jgi:hypothetical protein